MSLSLLGGALPMEAQSTRPGVGMEGSVGAHAGISVGVGTLKGTLSPQVGGRIGVEFLPWLRAGGEGTVILQTPRLAGEELRDQPELSLGYGGLFLEVSRRDRDGGDPWGVGLLLGAGTARVRSPGLEAPVDSRNLFLLEPSVARHLELPGPLRGEGRLAYRLPLRPPSPVGVRPADLRGLSLRLTLSLVRSP